VGDDGLPARAREGVALFNGGAFFEAHEAFEDCLDAVEDDARWDLLLGLIQVAVGYHKHASGHPGAARMLGLGAEKLASMPATAWGVAVGALRDRVAADRAALERGEPLGTPPRIELA
jgi:hypothetical protein